MRLRSPDCPRPNGRRDERPYGQRGTRRTSEGGDVTVITENGQVGIERGLANPRRVVGELGSMYARADLMSSRLGWLKSTRPLALGPLVGHGPPAGVPPRSLHGGRKQARGLMRAKQDVQRPRCTAAALRYCVSPLRSECRKSRTGMRSPWKYLFLPFLGWECCCLTALLVDVVSPLYNFI